MDNSLEITREALRQTEIRLEDLQMVATSVEQRAFQFSGAMVLIASLVAPNAGKFSSPIAIYMGVFGLVLSAVVALYSVLPRRFHVRGHYWSEWKPHLDDFDDLQVALSSQARENEDRIKFNERSLEGSAEHFMRSFLIALLSFGLMFLGQVTA